MRLLLKAIKQIVSTDTNLASLIGRINLGVATKSKVQDGPYAVVTVVGNQSEFALNDFTGYETTQLQISVFGVALNAADLLVDKLILALNGTTLLLSNGDKAYGRKVGRGVLSDPKDRDANTVFHSFCVIEFIYEDRL